MLPTVDFCGLNVTRLIIGANPFAGFSHQNAERDREMIAYHSVERILETWGRAEAAGINTFITNNTTPHVMEAVRAYLGGGGKMQWITQTALGEHSNMQGAVDEAVAVGCKALYFHGGLTDKAYEERNDATLCEWCVYAKEQGIAVGVAGHAPAAHLWVDSLDIVDFHVVCFFNCGSLHNGEGDKFKLTDLAGAVDAIQRIEKPCIGYKIMAAGRIDARMGFEYAFEHIKETDAVNVGMHRGDVDDMVEKNAAMVEEILAGSVSTPA